MEKSTKILLTSLELAKTHFPGANLKLIHNLAEEDLLMITRRLARYIWQPLFTATNLLVPIDLQISEKNWDFWDNDSDSGFYDHDYF